MDSQTLAGCKQLMMAKTNAIQNLSSTPTAMEVSGIADKGLPPALSKSTAYTVLREKKSCLWTQSSLNKANACSGIKISLQETIQQPVVFPSSDGTYTLSCYESQRPRAKGFSMITYSIDAGQSLALNMRQTYRSKYVLYILPWNA